MNIQIRIPAVTLALVVLMAIGAGFLLARHHYRIRQAPTAPAPDYTQLRTPLVLVQAQLAGPVETLVIGDSITETNRLDNICGSTFAAGIGGARIADARRTAPELIHWTAPRRIVLAIGTNDVLHHSQPSVFRKGYRALIESLPVKPYVLVGVRGSENAFIRAEAARIGAAYVMPLAAALTRDGVHPTAEGARILRAGIARACPDHAAIAWMHKSRSVAI